MCNASKFRLDREWRKLNKRHAISSKLNSRQLLSIVENVVYKKTSGLL